MTGSVGGRDAVVVVGGTCSTGGLGYGVAGVKTAAGEGTRIVSAGLVEAGGMSTAVRVGLTGTVTELLPGCGGDGANSVLGEGVVLTGANSGTAGGVVMGGFGRGFPGGPRAVKKGLDNEAPYEFRMRVAGLGPGDGKPLVGFDDAAGDATDS